MLEGVSSSALLSAPTKMYVRLASSPNACMTVAADNKTVSLASCGNANAQTWTYTGTAMQAMGGCLQASGYSRKAWPLVLAPCQNGANSQQFVIKGSTLTAPSSSRCVGAPSTNNGTQLQVARCDGSVGQQWQFDTNVTTAGGFVDTLQSIDPNRWSIANGYSNGGTFDCGFTTQAVSTSSAGMAMTISQGDYSGMPYSCAEIDSKTFYTYGTFSARMKAIPASGVITALFTYISTSTGDQAINIEITGLNTKVLWATSWLDGTSLGKSIPLSFDASADYHDYAFDWRADHITWYVDGQAVYTLTQNLPRPVPAYFIANTWVSTGDPSWAGYFTYPGTPLSSGYEWISYAP